MKPIAALLFAATLAWHRHSPLREPIAGVSQPPYPYSKAQSSLTEPQLAQSSGRADCVRACSQQLGHCGQSDDCQKAWKICVAACPQ